MSDLVARLRDADERLCGMDLDEDGITRSALRDAIAALDALTAERDNLHTDRELANDSIRQLMLDVDARDAEIVKLTANLRGAQALADEKCRCFLVRAEGAEAEIVALRAAIKAWVGAEKAYGAMDLEAYDYRVVDALDAAEARLRTLGEE